MRVARSVMIFPLEGGYGLCDVIGGVVRMVDASLGERLLHFQRENKPFLPGGESGISQGVADKLLEAGLLTVYGEREEIRELHAFYEARLNRLKSLPKQVVVVMGEDDVVKERGEASRDMSRFRGLLQRLKAMV